MAANSYSPRVQKEAFRGIWLYLVRQFPTFPEIRVTFPPPLSLTRQELVPGTDRKSAVDMERVSCTSHIKELEEVRPDFQDPHFRETRKKLVRLAKVRPNFGKLSQKGGLKILRNGGI